MRLAKKDYREYTVCVYCADGFLYGIEPVYGRRLALRKAELKGNAGFLTRIVPGFLNRAEVKKLTLQV